MLFLNYTLPTKPWYDQSFGLFFIPEKTAIPLKPRKVAMKLMVIPLKVVGVGVAGVDADVVVDVVEDVADKVCSQEYWTYISYDIQLRNLGTNFWICPFQIGKRICSKAGYYLKYMNLIIIDLN